MRGAVGSGSSRVRGNSLAGIIGGDVGRAAHITPRSPVFRRHSHETSSTGTHVDRAQEDAQHNALFESLARPLLPRDAPGARRSVRAAKPRTLLEGLPQAEAVRLAAVYMKDGVHGRSILHRTDAASLRRYHVYHGRVWHSLVVLAGFANLLLAVVEPTSGWLSDQKWPLGAIFALEMSFLALFSVDLALQLSFREVNMQLLRDKWLVTKFVTIVLLSIGACMAFALPHLPRLLRTLRPLLVIERLSNVRKICGSILMSVPKIFTAALLLVFHIFIFGLFAFVLYAGVRDGECHVTAQPTYQYCSVFSKDCTDYFSRIIDSMLHLFTLITTANYPDVMMPVYDCNTYNAIFFIVFLIIGLYFLLSLVLAVTYTHFQEKTKEKVIKQLRRRVTGLTMAFNTLAGPKALFAPTHKYVPRSPSAARRASGGSAGSAHTHHSASEADASLLAAAEARTNMLHRGGSRRGSFSFSAYVAATPEDDKVSGTVKWIEWQHLMRELRPDLGADFLAVLFDIVDADHDGQITLSEFQHLASLAEVDVTETLVVPRKAHRQRNQFQRGVLRARRAVKAVVYGTYSVFVWDLLVLCSCGFLLYQSIERWDATPATKRILYKVQLGFLFVFLAELALKTFCLGVGRFWRQSVFNKVDFIAILGAALSTLVVVEILGEEHSPVIQAFYFMRMLRLMRTLRNLGQFRVMITSFVDIIPALMRYLCVSLAAYYVFAIIGMQLFSHKFIRGKLVGTAYYSNDYWKNNFDSLHTSMVVLFELMVVNNWPINMEAAVRATSTNARWFYLAWYFVAVIVVINVLVAFLLDSFSTRKALNENKEQSMEHIWNKLFTVSCLRLGYDPKRWTVVRKQRIGDLYEAMYQADLKEDPLFEASTRGALVYQSTRHEEELRDKFGTVTDPGDVRRKRAIEAVLNRNKATGKLEQEHVIRRSTTSVHNTVHHAAHLNGGKGALRIKTAASARARVRVPETVSESSRRRHGNNTVALGAVGMSPPDPEHTMARVMEVEGGTQQQAGGWGGGAGAGAGAGATGTAAAVAQHPAPAAPYGQPSASAAPNQNGGPHVGFGSGAGGSVSPPRWRTRENSANAWALPPRELLRELTTEQLTLELHRRRMGSDDTGGDDSGDARRLRAASVDSGVGAVGYGTMTPASTSPPHMDGGHGGAVSVSAGTPLVHASSGHMSAAQMAPVPEAAADSTSRSSASGSVQAFPLEARQRAGTRDRASSDDADADVLHD